MVALICFHFIYNCEHRKASLNSLWFQTNHLFCKSGIHFYRRSFHQRQKAIQWWSSSLVPFGFFIISHTCSGRVQLGEESWCRNSPASFAKPSTQHTLNVNSVLVMTVITAGKFFLSSASTMGLKLTAAWITFGGFAAIPWTGRKKC